MSGLNCFVVLSVLVVLFGFGPVGCSAKENVVSIELRGFNYEISKRTEDIVNIFLDKALPPVLQTVKFFQQGALSVNDKAAVQKHVFLQAKAATSVYYFFVNFADGSGIGYIQKQLLLNSVNSPGPCQPSEPSTPTTHCMGVYLIDRYGNPTAPFYTFTVDPISMPRWNQTVNENILWAASEPGDLTLPSITYSGILRDSNGTLIAVAAASMLFSDLDNFLRDNFADQDDRVVFIVMENLDLVGASIPDVSYTLGLTSGVVFGDPIKAYNCSNERIRVAGQFMASLPTLNGTNGMIFVHADQFIQINQVTRLTLRWYVVVTRPVDAPNDFITTASTTFLGACVVCAVALGMCGFVFSWVWRHRRMKLWSYSQPRILLGLIACHVLCVVFGFLVVVPPSDDSCRARVFVGTMAVTCVNSAILRKVLYMYLLDSPIEALVARKSMILLAKSRVLIYVFISVQLFLSALQALGGVGGPVEVDSYYAEVSGEVVLRKECVNNGMESGILVLQTFVICLLCVCACCFAFLIRTASISYAESKGMLLVALQAMCLSIGFICVELFGTVRLSVMVSLLELMAVVWFVAICQAIMFVPRMFRQLTAGDLTLAELREMIQQHSMATKQRQK